VRRILILGAPAASAIVLVVLLAVNATGRSPARQDGPAATPCASGMALHGIPYAVASNPAVASEVYKNFTCSHN